MIEGVEVEVGEQLLGRGGDALGQRQGRTHRNVAYTYG
jgi:hypothetical protein